MTTHPVRIYHWLNTQLSIARFYGGITYNGRSYRIAHDEEGQPLVLVPLPEPKKRRAKKEKAA